MRDAPRQVSARHVLARHALVDLWDCDGELLEDDAFLQATLTEAAKIAEVTIVGQLEHHYSPQGYTLALVLEESHMVLHTWPEHDYVSLDLFSCNLGTDFEAVRDFLCERLRAGGSDYRLVERGVLRTPAS